MNAKRVFLYVAICIVLILLVLWVVGSQVLGLKGLSFDRQGAAEKQWGNAGDASNSSTNKTAQVVAGILSAYREVASSNEAQDPAQIEALLRESLNSSLGVSAKPVVVPTITIADLHVVPNTPEAQQNYLRGMGNIVRNSYHTNLSQELVIFNNVFNEKVNAEQKKTVTTALKLSQESYKKIADGLSKLSVPSTDIERTVTLVNAYLALSVGSGLLAQALDDPVLALGGIQTYAQGYLSLKNNTL